MICGRTPLLLLSLAYICVHNVDGYTYNNVDTLTTALFGGYKKFLRPFEDSSTATNVYLGIWLASIVDLDEINQELTFSAFLYLDWIDNRLSWTPSNYNNTMYFSFPQSEIWIPDVTIQNSVETMSELGFDRNYMYVQHDGIIQWLPSGVFSTSCDIDVTYYPFDTQTCSVVFSTLVTTANEVHLEADSLHSVDLSLYSESGTWELVRMYTSSLSNFNGKKRVSFSIELKRLRLFYVISLVIPVSFLALTATLVFALPADSGEKMGTCITVLLAYAVYLTIISDHMPQTSLHVSLLATYLNIVLGQTAVAVLITVWILNLHFRDDNRPPCKRMRQAAFVMQMIMCKRENTSEVTPLKKPSEDSDKTCGEVPPPSTLYRAPTAFDQQPDRPQSLPPKKPPSVMQTQTSELIEVEDMTWKEVSVTFDRFLFYFFSILLTLLTLVFMMVLSLGGST